MMDNILTGKAKDDFNSWWVGSLKATPNSIPYYNGEKLTSLSFSMQFGIYEDFFDVMGVTIQIVPSKIGEDLSNVTWYHYYVDDYVNTEMHDSRKKVRIEAINKAVEIYNSKSLVV